VSYYNRDAYDLGHYPADLFLTVRRRLEERWESMTEDGETDEEEERKFALMRRSLSPHMPKGAKRRRETGVDYLDQYTYEDVDDSGLVAVTWGQEGICAPAELYREPSKDDQTIWSEVRKARGAAKWLEEAEKALNDGYPATALKLGKDVRHLGPKVSEPDACGVMERAYVALGRPLLAEVLKGRTAQREAWDAEQPAR
jgi:hypothetical protein